MKSSPRIAAAFILCCSFAACDDPAKNNSPDTEDSGSSVDETLARMAELREGYKEEVDGVKADLQSTEDEVETLREELREARKRPNPPMMSWSGSGRSLNNTKPDTGSV